MIFTAHIVEAAGTFQKVEGMSGVKTIVDAVISSIVIPVIEGLFVFTFLIFIWGVVSLIAHADDPKAREKGQQHILWGVVGILIMISAYGIVRVIGNTIHVGDPFQAELGFPDSERKTK